MKALMSTPEHVLIADWLARRVADHLDRPADDIDPTVPLAELGLDSVSAVGICGEIEDEWGLDVDPTIVFDYPAIVDLAAYIADEVGTQRERAA
ncbi:acyl carrier protein [Nocardia sp. CA-136227]|uniref:acyl carrier protein n=1 Tax=Nocardia sp. CA-136227 TaxID=3239979 RepID=UPI003D9892BA